MWENCTSGSVQGARVTDVLGSVLNLEFLLYCIGTTDRHG